MNCYWVTRDFFLICTLAIFYQGRVTLNKKDIRLPSLIVLPDVCIHCSLIHLPNCNIPIPLGHSGTVLPTSRTNWSRMDWNCLIFISNLWVSCELTALLCNILNSYNQRWSSAWCYLNNTACFLYFFIFKIIVIHFTLISTTSEYEWLRGCVHGTC